MQDWVPAVRDLCKFFQQYDKQMALLNLVDKEMRDEGKSLEEMALKISTILCEITNASACYLAIRSGDYFWPLDLENDSSYHKIPASALMGINLDNDRLATLELIDSTAAFPARNEVKSVLIAPIDLEGHDWFGALILECSVPRLTSLSVDRGFIVTLRDQISNAFFFRNNLNNHSLVSELLINFFNTGMKPSDCLREVAIQASSFLPSYGPFSIKNKLDVQILFYNEGDDFLTIKATEGEEKSTERVAVIDSVCGYLVEDRNLNYKLINPQTDPRYKWYLGRMQGKIMQHELAVALRYNGNLFAVLNLETEQAEAFKAIHIEACIKLARQIEPWIFVLKERIEKDWVRQMASTQSAERYFDSAIDASKHNIGNFILGKVTLKMDEIITSIRDGQALDDTLSDLDNFRIKSIELPDQLFGILKPISKISSRGKYSIKSLLKDTIEIVQSCYEKEIMTKTLIIDFSGDKDEDVYCSPAIKLHLLDIFQNSCYWIKKKKMSNPSYKKGIIEVKLDKALASLEKQEKDLNRRVVIVITDNGPGVSPSILKELKRFEPGLTLRAKEGGKGFGFFAAKEYLTSIGGWLELDSKEEDLFQVKVTLDIFDDNIHRQ